ncbi:MAG: PulJ/GspJ family protein [Candidatus Binatia bacterium]
MTVPRWRATAGTSLVEVLVTVGILGIAMGVAYTSVIAQLRRHATEMVVAETMSAGRTAFDVMRDQVAMAGFGVPVGGAPSTAATIVTAEPSRLSFWASTRGAHTYLAAAAAKGGRTYNVLNSGTLKVGGSVYLADASRWYLGTVESLKGTSVQVGSDLPYDFAPGALVVPVELITFELAKGNLVRNGRVFIPNVSSLVFTYDATAPADVRVVTVSMSVATRSADPSTGKRRTLTLGGRVAPPNLPL